MVKFTLVSPLKVLGLFQSLVPKDFLVHSDTFPMWGYQSSGGYLFCVFMDNLQYSYLVVNNKDRSCYVNLVSKIVEDHRLLSNEAVLRWLVYKSNGVMRSFVFNVDAFYDNCKQIVETPAWDDKGSEFYSFWSYLLGDTLICITPLDPVPYEQDVIFPQFNNVYGNKYAVLNFRDFINLVFGTKFSWINFQAGVYYNSFSVFSGVVDCSTRVFLMWGSTVLSESLFHWGLRNLFVSSKLICCRFFTFEEGDEGLQFGSLSSSLLLRDLDSLFEYDKETIKFSVSGRRSRSKQYEYGDLVKVVSKPSSYVSGKIKGVMYYCS
jgi:hypothetical protein